MFSSPSGIQVKSSEGIIKHMKKLL